jgi:uncharacterized membrane protein
MRKYKRYLNTRCVFFLSVVVTLVILLFPIPTLAQEIGDSLIINLTSGYYDTEIAAGESKTIYFELANKSDVPTTDIEFSYDAPKGWLLEFNPGNIAIIESHNYETVEVTVTAPANVEKGGYSITIITDSSAGGRVASAYFRVEKGSNIWLWVGGGLGVLVIILFVFVYRRFARN